MIRVVLIIKQGLREIHRLIHPSAVIPIKLGPKTVSDRVVEAVWGFFAIYMISFVTMSLALLASGLDFLTAFSAVGACLNNLGPGMGDVAATMLGSTAQQNGYFASLCFWVGWKSLPC